ncbi:pentatricopeptide repeat-containing protein At4g38010-like [Curcuma longa]|uniref:pentatricopeptide repeat-containing protein At4g38010-like n=1 Tax=Curcuma longa TaxID=136217 RepID=UPI003D9F5298
MIRRLSSNPSLRSLSPDDALQQFDRLLHLSPFPSDHRTYAFLLRLCSFLHPVHGLQLHARLLKFGFHSHLVLQNSLLSFYSSAADIPSIRRVFAGIARPDVVSWTSFVSALARAGRDVDALAAFRSMDVLPNALTLVGVLPACARLGELRSGRAIHGFARRGARNVILDNAILDFYMRCGDLLSARNLFGEMPLRDVVSWTTLISGCNENRLPEEAISAFCAMLRDGISQVQPNEATLVSVLRACTSLTALSRGKSIHSYLIKSWVGVNVLTGNALINMYAKCGELAMAWRVFRGLTCRDSVSWSTMIAGFAMNSRAELAFRLFALMICHGLKPDSVTFLALLTACCHAGLVDQGLTIFMSMSKIYRICPEKKHFTCMIDTLGRAGRLKEAEEFFKSLPIEPDKHVVGALLSAGKKHGCNQAESKLFYEKDFVSHLGVGGGTYALVSNILADAGRYEASYHVRDLMRTQKVKKTAGCSRIGVH